MALSDQQKERVRTEAARLGVDPNKLLEAAEAELAGAEGEGADRGAGDAAPAVAAQPPLYMYHLPFVTVNEVRVKWLGLGEVPGGDIYAGEWAAAQLKKTSGA